MTNKLTAVGQLTDLLESHEYTNRNGETVKYYKASLVVPRLSETTDYIPLVISDSVLGDLTENAGLVSVEGEIHTRNFVGEDKHSHLSVFVKVSSIAKADGSGEPVNNAELCGVICKPPSLRETATGRIISDLLIAHNSRIGNRTKSYYVPALVWGSAAKAAHRNLSVGDSVMIKGRLQSRKYHCKNDPEDVFHWAYEISVGDFQKQNTEEESDVKVA